MAASPSAEPPLHRGIVEKRGHSFFGFAYQKRLFVLGETGATWEIAYFKNNIKKGSIPMRGATVKVIDDTTFVIETPNKKFPCRVDTHSECITWVEKIGEAIRRSTTTTTTTNEAASDAASSSTTDNDGGNGNAPLLATLSRLGRDRHPHSDTAAVTAPEEPDRVPMLQRGVTPAFVSRIVRELEALGRGDIDCGQLLNGVHTTSSATDWQEFDRSRDAFCLKACCLHTGLSFVETCILAGLTHDPDTGEAYFGTIKTFVSYTWRSDPNGPKTITVRNLKEAVEDTLTAADGVDPEAAAFFIDVFACAQHRAVRTQTSGTCPNAIDVESFGEVFDACERLVLFCTHLTSRPKALDRTWCLFRISGSYPFS